MLARVCALLLWLTACAHTQPEPLVLPYHAFGPQVMAYETLGFEWWQWQPHGDSRPRPYDIHVIVYRGSPEAEIAKRYPVEPAKEIDYRYISYEKALEYLDANIAQAEDADDGLPSLATQLRETRAVIVRHFGE